MIAILGAMQEEIAPLLKVLGDYKEVKHANNTFYLANFKSKELVIAYSKIGKVNAALTATVMIEKFGATRLLFTGVAGALNENLKIGDMLYASSLVQHDLDITAFGHPYGYVPGTSIFVKSDANLNALAAKIAKEKGINLLEGIIATGDQFVCNAERKEWIKNTFKADATEMEGASVALVCESLGVPFFILRAISDEAGGGAEFDFDEFLQSSADVSADFVLSMVEEL
ncbi:5'-methylthioadenosine/adenosylhomocysteine nucleosidase [Campylobacter sp. CCUG 57310]|uniref:5'-methylthioadenosine/adenosylhomocysteine nucleosidase n=1 Tax=Campylobacter sp. CCUG 57310 TaxID=2517362 RepID=UPI0015660FFF|nr:5'-methylthioadenosine/adenosylhomocysteine nucleosidase [Campylobacter sp. CCUG 57310]QKF92800.1 multifunctional 5'-methylthioadenosine / S-adenosylhomocysteine nucleosidase / 6-amino-6-deoxyfutalosine hydrolase [Campylobacter sp. CCUG 57310]